MGVRSCCYSNCNDCPAEDASCGGPRIIAHICFVLQGSLKRMFENILVSKDSMLLSPYRVSSFTSQTIFIRLGWVIEWAGHLGGKIKQLILIHFVLEGQVGRSYRWQNTGAGCTEPCSESGRVAIVKLGSGARLCRLELCFCFHSPGDFGQCTQLFCASWYKRSFRTIQFSSGAKKGVMNWASLWSREESSVQAVVIDRKRTWHAEIAHLVTTQSVSCWEMSYQCVQPVIG